jgi:hypothetical protein
MHDLNAVLAPLERAGGRRLDGDRRLRCAAAFAENPDGFRALAAEALKRARTNPVGLLWRMVEAGEDRLAGDPRLERVLAWARRTAPQLPPEAVDEVLATFHLSPAREADVRRVIAARTTRTAA